jgi:SAM-dependent methyltransferase
MLLEPVRPSARIIEIGPSHNPIAPKSKGWNTIVVDHATRAELIVKYTPHGIDLSKIEEVDYVWTGGPLINAIPPHLHGTFDAIIASHVIEHTTDFVGFLEGAETLLAPNGIVILAVPDKRYCFDYFRPLTTTGQVLYAHASRRSRHARYVIFDEIAYAVKNKAKGEWGGAWGQEPVRELDFFHSIEQAEEEFSKSSEEPSSPYIDKHAWQFTPASFELILVELARLGQTDWQVQHVSPAMGFEFHVRLIRGGKAAAAALTAHEVNTRRLTLLKRTLSEMREQIDFFSTQRRMPSYRQSAHNVIASVRNEVIDRVRRLVRPASRHSGHNGSIIS